MAVATENGVKSTMPRKHKNGFILSSVDYQYCQMSKTIQTYLSKNEIQTRPSGGLGLWCLYLVPISIIWSCISIPPISGTYWVVYAASFCFLVAAHLLMFNILMPKENLRIPALILGNVFCVGVMSYVTICGIYQCCILSVLILHWYPKLSLFLLKKCPKSFTLGEGCIIAHAVGAFLVASVTDLYDMWGTDPQTWTEVQYVNVILELGLLGILCLISLPLFFPACRDPVYFSLVFVGVMGAMVFPLLWIYFQQFPFIWFYEMISDRISRPILLLYWATCTVISIVIVELQMKSSSHASTAVRKYFHFLMVAICVPGVTLDPVLLYLASGVSLGVFCFLESLRILPFPFVGPLLQTSFSVFIDEKDVGPLILAHIYLLCGCCIPLWLHPTILLRGARRALLSGMLAVGVGDAAASICGSMLGKRKWPGSQKTLEGTLASVVCQGLALAFMVQYELVTPCSWSIILAVAAAVVTALVESLTDQVDNLVLPLLAYILLV